MENERKKGFIERKLKKMRDNREKKEDELDDNDFLSEDDFEDEEDENENQNVNENSSATEDNNSKKDDKDNKSDKDDENDKKSSKENEDDPYNVNHKTRTSLDDFDDQDRMIPGVSVGQAVVVGGAIVTVGLIVAGGYALMRTINNGIKKIKEDKTTEITTEATTEDYESTTEVVIEEPTTEEIVEEKPDINKYNDMNDLLTNAKLSDVKKEALSKIWNYVNYYNTTVANQNMEENNTAKLAISWDEAMAQYLIYNKSAQDPSVITAIFDMYKLSADSLKKDFETSTELDYEACHILNQETNKAALFDDDGAQLYNKYEDIVSKLNSTKADDKTLRKDIADRFYSSIRSDFNLSGNSSYNDPYKTQMLPLSKAMFEMLKDVKVSNKLSKEEKKQLKNVANVDDIIATICGYNIDTVTEDEFSYEEIREFAINQLVNTGAYNLDNRDIKSYAKYQESIKEKEETTEEEKTEVKENQTSSQESNNNYSEETTEEKKESKKKKTKKTDDDDKSDKIPDWMLEENNSNNTEINVEPSTDNTEYIDEEIPEVQPDTPDVSYNNKIINSSVANISDEMMQAYFDAVATAIVENMANNTTSSKEKSFVKSM